MFTGKGCILKIFTDGASKGNPGPAAIGIVGFDSDVSFESFKIKRELAAFFRAEPIGSQTNNVAEYQAFVSALQICKRKGITANTVFHLDSELIVKQINGAYKVKNANLRPLYIEAMNLLNTFDSSKVIHVPRNNNRIADYLANEAIIEQRVIQYGL